MSDAESEKEAVRVDRPSLPKTKVLEPRSGVENEIELVKLLGLVVITSTAIVETEVIKPLELTVILGI